MKNKTRLLARVMLFVLLLTEVLNLTGCVKSQLEKGQYYDETHIKNPTSLRVTSKSYEKKMDINNVTLQLNIGLNKKEYSLLEWITKDITTLMLQQEDTSTIVDDSNAYYVLYVHNPDIKEIDYREYWLDDVYVLKEIPCNEAYTNVLYNWSVHPWNSESYYNHCETITIPKEYFVNGKCNTIYISLCKVIKVTDGDQESLLIPENTGIGIPYCIHEDSIVSLYFKLR